MVKVGIGVTTHKRPKHIVEWCKRFASYSSDINYHLHIENDVNGVGVAASKNSCLRALSGCDYVVLFDDDCFVNRNGWFDYLLRAYEISGEGHFMYLREWQQVRLIGYHKSVMGIFNNCGGVMMFFTKDFIKENGFFDDGFGRYGFEHAEYSLRGWKNGLISHPFMSPVGLDYYLSSLDYGDENLSWHKSSISDFEKNVFIKKSILHFKKKLK